MHMNFKFVVSLLINLCCLLQLLPTFVPTTYASSHTVSQRQSEFVDILWCGRLIEPYLTARAWRSPNSHVLCHSTSGLLSLVFSRGPIGATYAVAHLNTSFTSKASAASGEQLPNLSARHRRAQAAGPAETVIRLGVVLTDAKTARLVDVNAQTLFTSAEYGQECI